MNTGTNEHNLQELAYRIWEAEGCPPGQADRHWKMALEQARMEQETSATGDSFLGDTLASDHLLQDERQYASQNNPFDGQNSSFQEEVMEPPMEAGGSQQPLKNGKRKSAKSKAGETFADQDMAAATQSLKGNSRGKSGKQKPSENILA